MRRERLGLDRLQRQPLQLGRVCEHLRHHRAPRLRTASELDLDDDEAPLLLDRQQVGPARAEAHLTADDRNARAARERKQEGSCSTRPCSVFSSGKPVGVITSQRAACLRHGAVTVVMIGRSRVERR